MLSHGSFCRFPIPITLDKYCKSHLLVEKHRLLFVGRCAVSFWIPQQSFQYPERVLIFSQYLLEWHSNSQSSQFLSKVTMVLHNPNSRSSQRPNPSVLDKFIKQIQLMCYRYEVTFSPYVMTPGEKFVINTVVLVLLSLLTLGTFFYMPRFVARVATRLVWLSEGPGDRLRLVSMDNTTAIWKDLGPVMNY
jgi:hypothetical protein